MTVACPSCRNPMQPHTVAAHHGAALEIDLCHACHGLWLDGGENLRMAPQGVIDLFMDLHAHRDDPHHPLATHMACPRCQRALVQGVDLVRSGRYTTWRCPERHGRFATFSAFMVEKGFVRQLTRPEIADLAERVRVIHCTSCGAPVDLRHDHACPYCRAAFTLLDPKAVEQALANYDRAARREQAPPAPTDLADALIALERDRERDRREAHKGHWSHASAADVRVDDLWAAGVHMVWGLLSAD